MEQQKVIVLMSTYNGEKYLQEQVDSLLGQGEIGELRLLVRDDGSTDKTQEILKNYQSQGVLKWYAGENLKPAKSFMRLLADAPDADYYAFCDQDDVWLPDKLKQAVQLLNQKDKETPCLYFSNVNYVNQKLEPLEGRPKIEKAYTLAQAILGNNVIGCTMVINRKLKELCSQYLPEVLIMHDSWINQVCLSAGGQVVFDSRAFILYRQHENNTIGSNRGISFRYRHSGLRSSNVRWRIAQEIYEAYGNELTEEARELLETVINYRDSCRSKLRFLRDRRFWRSTKETLLFWFYVVFNKF